MKKMLKILSIILAISMVISLIPASFAAEGDADYAGVTVVYPLWQGAYGGTLKPYEITYTNTYSAGRMQWHSDTSSYTHNPGWGKGTIGLHLKAGEYAAWTIKVPASGLYDISMTYGVSPGNTKGMMYLVPGNAKNVMSEISEENYVMTVDFNAKEGQPTTEWADFDDFYNKDKGSLPTTGKVTKELTAGEYTVVWVGIGDTSTTNSGRYILRPATMTLDGNGADKSLIYADLTGTKTELDAAIGEEANIVLNAVYMSDGKTASDTEKETITYSSSADSIATITIDNKIKAVSEGEATIYAKNGDYVLGQIDVSVNESEKSAVTVVYPLWQGAYGGTLKPYEITYTNTYSAGRMQWHSDTSSYTHNPGWGKGTIGLHLKAGEYAAWTIKVPASGLYDISMTYGVGAGNTKGMMYLVPGNVQNVMSEISEENYVMTVDFKTAEGQSETVWADFDNFYNKNKGSLPTTEKVSKELAAGEYTVVWVGTGETSTVNAGRYQLRPATMILDGGDGLAIMDLALAEHDKTLAKGENTTVTATGTLSNTGLQKNVGGAAKFTYTSSNPAVATVDANTGVVTAVSGGVAKITATCTNSSVIDGYNSISTLIAVDEPTTSVSFGADASVGGINITTNVSGYTQGEVGSVDLNTPVTVKAPETAKDGEKNYVFRGWVRGKADGGRVISLDATYSFTAMTNTYLTAIYTEAATEEYYAWNGEFLGTERTSAPEVLGYSFSEWKESLVNNIKRFVAWYVQKTETYGVTFNGKTIQYKYDDPVALSSDTNVYWYRDGKLVDYGTSYTFNVWDKTEITTSSEGHELPILALDAKAKDNTFMVEYDANGKTVIEVGILFNAETDGVPTVSSCKEKMSSQRNLVENPHGQFAAKAGEYTKARGYLIYEDNGAYKVIYSE